VSVSLQRMNGGCRRVPERPRPVKRRCLAQSARPRPWAIGAVVPGLTRCHGSDASSSSRFATNVVSISVALQRIDIGQCRFSVEDWAALYSRDWRATSVTSKGCEIAHASTTHPAAHVRRDLQVIEGVENAVRPPILFSNRQPRGVLPQLLTRIQESFWDFSRRELHATTWLGVPVPLVRRWLRVTASRPHQQWPRDGDPSSGRDARSVSAKKGAGDKWVFRPVSESKWRGKFPHQKLHCFPESAPSARSSGIAWGIPGHSASTHASNAKQTFRSSQATAQPITAAVPHRRATPAVTRSRIAGPRARLPGNSRSVFVWSKIITRFPGIRRA